MEKNELIPKKDSIITKLKEKLYYMFHHDDRKDGNAKKTANNTNTTEEHDENYLNEKKRILDMYEKLKKNQISVYEIPRHDLRLIKEIMIKEIELKEEKINQLQTDINMSIRNIEYYTGELEKYQNKLDETN